MIIVQVTLQIKNVMLFINSWKNELWEKYIEINHNLLQEIYEIVSNIGGNTS